MKMNLEQLLTLAYESTEGTFGSKVYMSTGRAINQSKYMQTFEAAARPRNHRIPRTSATDGMIVSSAVGYKQLTVWVYFGDNAEWTGPQLKWLYQDNSMRCMGPSANGDESNLDELARYSKLVREEHMRIAAAESAYLAEHGTLEGFRMDGYATND